MGFRFPRPSNHSQGEKRSQIIGASPPGGAREGVYNFTLIASPPLQSAEPVLATSSSSPYSSLPACTCLNKTSFLLCSANGPLKKKSSSSSLLLPFFSSERPRDLCCLALHAPDVDSTNESAGRRRRRVTSLAGGQGSHGVTTTSRMGDNARLKTKLFFGGKAGSAHTQKGEGGDFGRGEILGRKGAGAPPKKGKKQDLLT